MRKALRQCPNATMFGRYLASTMAYGALHVMSRAPHYRKYTHEYTGEVKMQPILITHYACMAINGQALGPVLWPLMLYDDLTYLECKASGKDWTQYGTAMRIFTQ